MGSSGEFLGVADWRPFCPLCGQEAIRHRRHCEEQSDEAIQLLASGLLRFRSQ
jgi:hypothetical protein